MFKAMGGIRLIASLVAMLSVVVLGVANSVSKELSSRDITALTAGFEITETPFPLNRSRNRFLSSERCSAWFFKKFQWDRGFRNSVTESRKI